MRLLRFASLWCGLASSQLPPAGSLPGFKVAEEFSFRAPYTDVNPFTGQRQITNWDLGGTAVAHRSFVRLTAEAQGSKGWLVSQQPLTLPEWSAMLELRASGASANLYGDGLAIWLVKSPEHIEGPVFGRQDKWNGMGLFFDTFQNVDHSHHHKHPYIYVMMNDGTKLYVPDAEKPDPSNTVVPGSVDNSGCSYEFRYAENREDVSVLNHTRVHLTYRNRQLKVRLQQTSPGLNKEWFQCIDMKDVDVPSPGYFGISAATGDLVDNHDIVQFIVRPLAGIADPDADHDAWANAELAAQKHKLEEFDLRPPEALQRDYQRVLRAQAEAIKTLSSDVEALKQQLEFQIAAINNGLTTTRQNIDNKAHNMERVDDKLKQAEEMHRTLEQQKSHIADLKSAVSNVSGGGGWKFPFFLLFVMILGLAGVGYNRYNKLYGKSHLP